MRDREKAFTLGELLVVLSIMAMLLGILMPALAAARRVAYKTGCKENLHGCMIAFRMYLDDNKNVMPTITNMPVTVPIDNSTPLYAVLGKYLSGPEALKCPADRWPEKNTTYFRHEGSSYEYNRILAEQVIEKSRLAQRFGTNEVWILRDYETFHGKPGRAEARMWLFADTLVADRERNK